MCPARPTVLGNVLIEGVGEEGFTLDVAPVPIFGEIFLIDVSAELNIVRIGIQIIFS